MLNYNRDSMTREDNIITMELLNHPKCVSDFLRKVKECIQKGWNNIIIRNNADRVFPNACLPICGLIYYYSKNESIEFEFDIPENSYLSKCGFKAPFSYDTNETSEHSAILDKIFLYNSIDQVGKLSQAFIDTISHTAECEVGVLDGISWCINEVMDNVLTHSETFEGFIMAQFHPQTQHIAFCVYDTGIGIYHTLATSKHHPKTELDALSLAIQEGIGDGKGQGNGLYGLYQIVRRNGGRLSLTSGHSSIMLRDTGELEKFNYIPCISNKFRGTIVDFQIDTQKSIDIKGAFQSIGGYDGFDFRIDDMLADEDEFIHYNIFMNSQGTVTRNAGRYLRNDIINILRRENRCIILDFSDVKTVSSSFIDELIAKLVLFLGFIDFNMLIKITGMNDTIKFLCERSLYMRIHDEWDNKNADTILH